MQTRSLAAHDPGLEGLEVLVLGLGRSGLAAARLAASHGARVTIADRRDEDELGGPMRQARAAGATVHAGGHPPELAEHAGLLILSPGVPASAPVVEAARRLGVPVWSEIELAFRFCRGRVLGVTGSNGKSTTTSMAGAILRNAGIPGGTGGNLGTPFTELLSVDAPDAVHAVELSSFQLETIDAFHASAGVVLNLSPDHMDRYAAFDDYAAAKARLLTSQLPDEAAVLNHDDPESRRFRASVRGRLHLFSIVDELDAGAYVRAGRIVLRTDEGEDDVMAVGELSVPGDHNLSNALAAALTCRLCGAPPGAIAAGLRAFRALPHRLEFVASFDGVDFYNDSKATNLDAARRALRSFPPRRVHLVLGGRDKGADWSLAATEIALRARTVLLVGEATPVIAAALSAAIVPRECGTIRAAVREAFEVALPGDVVLLAPGCASFDQYRNFEERGLDFRGAVEALFPDGGHRA